MIPRTLGEIAATTGGEVRGRSELTIDAVATDSRDVPSGAPLFVALRGEHGDGHDHIRAAIGSGAVAVMTERDQLELDTPAIRVHDTWQALTDLAGAVRDVVDPTAVAITGSVGKTTVKDLTAAAVSVGRITHASRGSFNNELGVPLTLLGLETATQVLVAEVGARHLGDIAALSPLIRPDVAVVTAVAAVHLEVFGSIDAVARAKAELVDALDGNGTAILNLDDPRVAAMAGRAPDVIGVGLGAAPVTARDVSLDRLGRPRGIAVTPWGEVELSLPVAGRHQLLNGLFALAVAGHLGIDLDAAAEAIGATTVSRWRGQVVRIGDVTVLDDAYNANPTSMAAALDTLSSMNCDGRRWAVLGVMAEIGADASEAHEEVGRRCIRSGIDEIVVVGSGAAPIVDGALAAGAAPDRVHEVADVPEAVEVLGDRLAPGDLLLVKASRVAGLEQVVERLRSAENVPEDRPK